MGTIVYPSRYNHLVRIATSNRDSVPVVCNLLFGAADVTNEEVYQLFWRGAETGVIDTEGLTPETLAHFVDHGFLWYEASAEEEVVAKLGASFGGRDEIAAGLGGGHYGFITSLDCNLACPYCFQRERADSVGFLTSRQVDLAIEAIRECEARVEALAGKPTLPKISITGGEPLLQNGLSVEVLDYLMLRLDELGWPFSLTTNGTELGRFVDRHDVTPRCRNIQVTLDGPRNIHDLRRCFRGGQPSFDRIVAGMDSALAAGWNITLRVNLDLSNVAHLPELGFFIRDEKQWARNSKFSAYVSPVTDHGPLECDVGASDEADLLKELLGVVDGAPWLRDVFDIRHFRGFNYVEQMLVGQTPRFPVITRCEAISGMYIFDPGGNIYVCLESVGEPLRRVGRYDPRLEIDHALATRWSDRQVLKIPECGECKIRFVCAGGCAIEASNKGRDAACMPFLEEMETAWDYFGRTRPDLIP